MRDRLIAWAEPWIGSLLAELIFDQPLLSALGGLVAIIISLVLAHRAGLTWWRVLILGGLCALGGVVGARLGWAVIRYDYILEKPIMLVHPFGGSISFGALGGAVVFGYVAARLLKLPVWKMADLMAPAGILGVAFSRVGCLLRGCDYGNTTQLAWGVAYPPNSSVYRRQIRDDVIEAGVALSEPVHPFPIYLAISCVVVFAIATVFPRLFGAREGQLAAGTMLLWSIGRFVLEFWRYPGNAPMVFDPLSIAHVFALVTGLVAVGLLIWRGGGEDQHAAAG